MAIRSAIVSFFKFLQEAEQTQTRERIPDAERAAKPKAVFANPI